jgi:hypothetical protein
VQSLLESLIMQLIRTFKGSREVILTGDRKRLQARMRQLKTSTRRGVSGPGGKFKVKYEIEE